MKKTNLKRILLFFWVLLLLFLISSCADIINIDACRIDQPAGFFAGLWHGLVSPFSFIGSLFSDNIAVYAVNNTGKLYDFGFLWGVAVSFGGAGKAS